MAIQLSTNLLYLCNPMKVRSILDKMMYSLVELFKSPSKHMHLYACITCLKERAARLPQQSLTLLTEQNSKHQQTNFKDWSFRCVLPVSHSTPLRSLSISIVGVGQGAGASVALFQRRHPQRSPAKPTFKNN